MKSSCSNLFRLFLLAELLAVLSLPSSLIQLLPLFLLSNLSAGLAVNPGPGTRRTLRPKRTMVPASWTEPPCSTLLPPLVASWAPPCTLPPEFCAFEHQISFGGSINASLVTLWARKLEPSPSHKTPRAPHCPRTFQRFATYLKTVCHKLRQNSTPKVPISF